MKVCLGRAKKIDTRKRRISEDENCVTPENQKKPDSELVGNRKRASARPHSDSTMERSPVVTPAKANLRFRRESVSSDCEGLELKRPRRGSSRIRHRRRQKRVSFPVVVQGDDLATGRTPIETKVWLEDVMAECRRSDFALSQSCQTAKSRMEEVPEYIFAILASERTREVQPRFAIIDFLNAGRQPNVTTDMLTTLADWVLELQEFFTLESESMHLAWVLLFAYLCHGQPLAKRELQLMVCGAIFVANKFENHTMPDVDRFVEVSDDGYTKDEFLDAEMRLLSGLDFAVHRPNPYFFLRRYSRVLDAENKKVENMSSFLLDVGMHSYCISLKYASLKAASVLWLTRSVLGNPSYKKWRSRSDIQHLYHVISTSSSASRFYSRLSEGRQSLSSNAQRMKAGSNLQQSTQCFQSKGNCPTPSSNDQNENTLHRPPTKPPSTTHGVPSEDTLPTPLNDIFPCGLSCPPLAETVAPDDELNQPEDSSHHRSNSTLSSLSHSAEGSDLCPTLAADLESLHYEEEQRSPRWPPILQHITGYRESDLIPLALTYHRMAMRLIAEAARGHQLARQARAARRCRPGATQSFPRTIQAALSVSPGGNALRNQTVTKYCKWSLNEVADIYPNLAFENLLPHFPILRCRRKCTCFVCINLKRDT